MSESYRSAKEAFVSDMTGSSIGHINLISLAALLSVSFYGAFKTHLASTRNTGFIFSWAVLVLPLLLSMTVFANNPKYLLAILLLPNVLLLRMSKPETGTPLPSSTSTPEKADQTTASNRLPALPALTTYRGHMMLMTVLAILAVDFRVFPRSLVKCETYGASLMDLGVGSFVFSQGVVSAIPLVKDENHIGVPVLPKLISVTRKSLPIIALGLIRVLLVKGTDYPEHVTEYGVHWNFFITLALLPVLQVMLHPVLKRISAHVVGLCVGIFQQVLLTRFDLKDYVLNAPRTSVVSANKEGIVSLLGYLSIHILGLSIGMLVLPPFPSFFRRRRPLDLSEPRQKDKTATELCAYALVWWAAVGMMKLVGVEGKWRGGEGGVSRRMVNLPYIFWVAAYNASFLLAYFVILDMWIFSESKSRDAFAKSRDLRSSRMSRNDSALKGTRVESPSFLESGNPARLFEVINKQGLPIFLIANVFTGVINLSIPTIYVSDLMAMGILCAYSMAICAVGWFWPTGGRCVDQLISILGIVYQSLYAAAEAIDLHEWLKFTLAVLNIRILFVLVLEEVTLAVANLWWMVIVKRELDFLRP